MNTSYAMLDHGLGEDLDMLRDLVYKFAQVRNSSARRRDRQEQ